MSDIAEMAKELQRAYDLNDLEAALRIAEEMSAHARTLELPDMAGMGDELAQHMKSRNWPAALALSGSMATLAGRIDARNRSLLGDGWGALWHEVGRASLNAWHSN